MKFTWLTDVHLNFLEDDQQKEFYRKITETNCDGVFITGDIAEAHSVADILQGMVHQIRKPIYFVLGNHDYYHGEVGIVRKEMETLTQTVKLLHWMPASGVKILDNNTALIGQDGWADGRLGDYKNSRVAINDSRLINDLFQSKILGKFPLLEKMQALSDSDAKKLQDNLNRATTKNPKKIIVLTHIPPFKEACLHEGVMSDDNWLPHFTSKVIGDLLIKTANNHPSIEFLVLCGHTHSEAHYKPLTNLTVKAGKAQYGRPEIQEIIII